jgi:hypothetical protein
MKLINTQIYRPLHKIDLVYISKYWQIESLANSIKDNRTVVDDISLDTQHKFYEIVKMSYP